MPAGSAGSGRTGPSVFEEAQELRPDGVTNFYRQGMLYRKIEDKNEKSLPLFQAAVNNWDALGTKEREYLASGAQEPYQGLVSTGLVPARGRVRAPGPGSASSGACPRTKRTNYLALLYKYFALGKINFYLNRFTGGQGRLAVRPAVPGQAAGGFCQRTAGPDLSGVGQPRPRPGNHRAGSERKRRPLLRWTEADVLCALREFELAREVLAACMERDARSRHKALIRLARLEYLWAPTAPVLDNAREAEGILPTQVRQQLRRCPVLAGHKPLSARPDGRGPGTCGPVCGNETPVTRN